MKPTAIFANQSHDWHRLPIFTENATLSRTEVEYQYDSAGNRVLSISVYNPESNNPFSQPVRTRTEYLTEDSNPTGYSQVLQETQYEVDANGDIVAPAKKIVYAIGHDQISQTVFVWNAGSGDWDAGDTHYFGTDGHGSVRVLWDAVAAIVRDAAAGVGAQIYHFDAYGNLLNFAGAVTPITSYLYSGESFDFNLGQQYLRARWYDATTGRFNRLDPYFGNSNDPQSFHKYAYVHGDPVHGVDPSGLMLSGAMISRLSWGAGFGAGISFVLNGVRNNALGKPFFEGWARALVVGAGGGIAIAFVPPLALLFAAGGLVDAIQVNWVVFSDPNSTVEERIAAASYGIAIIALGGLAYKGTTQHFANAKQLGRTGKDAWFWIEQEPTILLGRSNDAQTQNRFSLYQAEAAKYPTQEVIMRPTDSKNAPNIQVSMGAKFNPPNGESGTGIFNIDSAGAGRVSFVDVGHGTPQMSGYEPPSLFAAAKGGGSKAAGEFSINGNKVQINDWTSAGVRKNALARQFWRALGYEVEIVETRLVPRR